MIVLTTPISGLSKTFLQPIINKISKDLNAFFKTNVSKLVINTELESTPGSGGRISDTKGIGVAKPLKSEYNIEVLEEYNEEDITSTFISRRNAEPIILDKALPLEIKPVYVGTILRFKITYSSISKTDITNWYNNVRLQVSQDATKLYHTVDYYYLLPRTISKLIEVIHEHTEAVAGYDRSFQDYIQEISDDRITWMSDITARNIDLAISEKMNRVLGQFEYGPLPDKPEFDAGTTSYSVDINYTVYIDKPTHLHIRYPSMVHNQLLPEKYVLPKDFMKGKDEYFNRRNHFDHVLLNLERHHEQNSITPNTFIHTPTFDRWIPDDYIPFMGPIYSTMVQILPDDRRTIMNLRDINDIVMDETILDWIQSGERNQYHKLLNSFIYMGLYSHGQLLTDGIIETDQDLNVYATKDLDLRQPYRLMFYIVLDPSALTERAWNSLRRAPDVLKVIEDTISVNLLRNPSRINTAFNINTPGANLVHNQHGGYGAKKDIRINWNMRKGHIKTVQLSNIISCRGD